jgi:hypothetical protein
MTDRSDPLPFFGQADKLSLHKYPNRPPYEVNPRRESVGPYTGRCKRCQSNDLWDDCSCYGCNNCGAVYSN